MRNVDVKRGRVAALVFWALAAAAGAQEFRPAPGVHLGGRFPAVAPAAPGYHVAALIDIGGTDTSFDYLTVDAGARRLYVAHGTRVEVLEADTGARVGAVTGLSGAHAIEMVPELHRGFITNGVARTVTVFDTRTLETVATVKDLGVRPDALRLDPLTHLLFVANGGNAGIVSIIDPATAVLRETIALDAGKLEELGFDGRGHGYVNDDSRSVVHVIDTRARKETAVWPLAPGEEPTGLAVDAEHHRLFVACGNHLLVVLDSDNGHLLGTAPIGDDPDGIAYDGRRGRAFVSNRDATMTVVGEREPGQFVALQTIQTATGARTIALDERSGRLFLPAGELGPVPAPTPAVPEPHAPLVPDTFAILVIEP